MVIWVVKIPMYAEIGFHILFWRQVKKTLGKSERTENSLARECGYHIFFIFSESTHGFNILFQIICMLILLRYVGNVIAYQKDLPNLSSTFSQVSPMQQRKTLTLRKVRFVSALLENLLWDELQRFYLVCERGCPKLRHTMGCLVKSMPSSWMFQQFN